jgi:hypothetical protein
MIHLRSTTGSPATALGAALLFAVACGKKEAEPRPAPAAPSASPAPAEAPKPVAPAAAPASSPTPAAAPFLPAVLAPKTGIAFAETRGGRVQGKAANGSKTSIRDGAPVAVVSVHQAEMGDPDSSTVEVKVDGKRSTVPITAVLWEEALQRSPDGAFAVFSAITACGDLCHTEIFLVGRDGKRVPLGGGGVDVAVAWRPDGKEVAVGSGSLWLVALPGLTVRPVEDYMAPAYAPDGTLYVRDRDGSAYKLRSGKAKRVWKAPPAAEPEDGGDMEGGAMEPTPVKFDRAGKPNFALEF